MKIKEVHRWRSCEPSDTNGQEWYTTRLILTETTQQRVWLRFNDLSKILDMFFFTEWDEWGYLVPNSRCDLWVSILYLVMSIVHDGDSEDEIERFLNRVCCKYRGVGPGRFPQSCALDWDWKKGRQCAPRTKELVTFGKDVKGLISNAGEKLRVLIAILLAAHENLRQSVFASLLAASAT